jgi:WD40 repeat protein
MLFSFSVIIIIIGKTSYIYIVWMSSPCSVMDVKFVHRTHYMFSVGKDRTVKYWDADKFELLLTLEGHHAEVWCLTISSRGDFIVTGSHDRSIRRWDRTEEQLFIEVSCNYIGLFEISC